MTEEYRGYKKIELAEQLLIALHKSDVFHTIEVSERAIYAFNQAESFLRLIESGAAGNEYTPYRREKKKVNIK